MSRHFSLRKKSVIICTMIFMLTMLLAPMSAAAQPNTDQNMTRAEFISMIERAFGSNVAAPTELTGIGPMAWYVTWANGSSEDRVVTGPENPVTNEEAAVIFTHLKNLVADQAAGSRFLDGATANSWSLGAIGAVSNAGIMKGYADGTFQPGRFITQAEALNALQAALDYSVIKPLFIASPNRQHIDIDGIETLAQSIVVFQSDVEGAQVEWNGVTLDGVLTVRGTNAINVPVIIPGENNTLSVGRPGYKQSTTSNIVWGETAPQIENSGFETGSLEGWQVDTGGPFPMVQGSVVATGDYAAYLGDGASQLYYGGGTASIGQTISIVDEVRDPYLNLNYLVSGWDPGFDGVGILINGNTIATINGSSGWQNFQYDLSGYAGGDVNLEIESWTWDPLFQVNYYVDNVSITYQGGAEVIPNAVDVAATPLQNGQTLSDSLLSGTFEDASGNPISGTLTWLNPSATVNDGTNYYVCIFTPDDSSQYLPVANTVMVNLANDRHMGSHDSFTSSHSRSSHTSGHR